MEIPDYVKLRYHKSHKADKNIHVNKFDLFVGDGKVLLKDVSFNILYGKKHSIIGRNGLGKSCLLKEICSRSGPFSIIPEWYTIMNLDQEIIGDERLPLEIVLSADPERIWLLERLKQMESINNTAQEETEIEQENEYTIKDIYDRLKEINAFTAENRALSILKGLQFTEEFLNRPSNELSGGWRMRLGLARILLTNPDLAILDEPTNHLDLHAVMWLEKYLSEYKKTLLIVSHDETILTECIDVTFHLHDFKIKTYQGNYTTFLKIKDQNMRTENNQRRKDKQKGNDNGKKKKDKKEKYTNEKTNDFVFPNIKYSSETAIIKFEDVSFSYDNNDNVINNVSFGIYMDTRIALLSANGCGKSTLLKLMCGELIPTSGNIYKNKNIKIVKYHQHAEESLDGELNLIEYIKSIEELPDDKCLKALGRFGLSGKMSHNKIKTLSGGQKVRLVFAGLSIQEPHLILLDEPTNHLDIDSIKSLEKGLKEYNGGLVIISHNQSILTNCCNVIWSMKNGSVIPFDGTFEDYKNMIL